MYFSRFPTFLYSNTICTDITRRVRLSEETRNALTLYYQFEVKDGHRPDLIAGSYYDDPVYDWLIWLTNDIVDPYYQWNLSEQDFNNYLIKKYGSVETSIERTAFYRNNWYDDDNLITPEFYENTLAYERRKYYEPFYGNNTRVLYYKRREEDWTMETNEIWKGELANTDPFAVGDLIVMGNEAASPAIIVSGNTFNGEISGLDGNTVYIKNVEYTANAEVLTQIAPIANSDATVAIANVELVYRAIGLDEAVHWSKVSYYDIENEGNIYAQSIKILDRSQLLKTTEQIRKKLKNG